MHITKVLHQGGFTISFGYTLNKLLIIKYLQTYIG